MFGTQRRPAGKAAGLYLKNLSLWNPQQVRSILLLVALGPESSIHHPETACLNAPGLLVAAWHSTSGSPSAHVSCAEPVPAVRLSIRVTPCKRNHCGHLVWSTTCCGAL